MSKNKENLQDKIIAENILEKYSNNCVNIPKETIEAIKKILTNKYYPTIDYKFSSNYFNFLWKITFKERSEILFDIFEWINSDETVENLSEIFCNNLFVITFILCNSINYVDSFSDFISYIVYQIALEKNLEGIVEYFNWFYPRDIIGAELDYHWYKVIEKKFPKIKFNEVSENIKNKSYIGEFLELITSQNIVPIDFLNKEKIHFMECFNYIVLNINREIFNVYFLSNNIFEHIKTFSSSTSLYFPVEIYRLIINDNRFDRKILLSSLTEKYLKHFDEYIDIED